MQDATFTIGKIRCEGCLETLRKAALSLPGVETFEGDAAAKRVRLRFDPARVGEPDLRRAFAAAGFAVDEAPRG
ncbi:MAG: heavy-metal-associated domain-containing protein [Polyangiaceae bacterium]|jgi:copper chaperone CopZ|nr:heavy-metal-associated domain-containing protein [Polyangiaceae bacterium]